MLVMDTAKEAPLKGFVRVDRCAELVDVGAVRTDELMEFVTRNAEFFRPIRGVGGYFWVDQFGVVRTLGGVVFVQCMGFVAFA
jgi:hypothetical protein